ncbi:bifunctional enoyl-CoA hydratase/phosphate acetyltransferase [Litoreibacter roseus]|uniref:Phosphate acetyl/butyryl transferase n=1 Tax=Litoreibacter roseus TaxID=2601869 RepID=A0A6N6JC57_9RHOB|nr:bifunctional enoyl-CoA hydratase/phosphate acetyltransferase [Litoreibacter roseus]GFE62979.1 phosphate acetyl/butyryl transferase [Litoreibacter roseus]
MTSDTTHTRSPFLSTVQAVAPAALIARAKGLPPPRVAIARAGSALPMEAAKEAVEANMMEPLFTGEANVIRKLADDLQWDISGFEIIEAKGEAAAGQAAAEACGRGDADVLMKGQLHTDQFMKAALNRDAGLRTGKRLVHIFHITHPGGGRPLFLSDGAVNVDPNMETRQDAIRSVVDLMQTLDIDHPRVAILSATESVLDAVPSSGEARTLANWAAENIPNASVSGPLALDLILSPDSVATKGLTDDPVAGKADAIIVPDIVSGNALFKALVYLTGACAAGIVMGAKVPILLTSRADPPAARLASIALAAIVNATKGSTS